MAIETRYAGCHFRSRLEARWAVVFDELGIEWQYEPEGFEGAFGGRYLPDFYLPHGSTWVEVKGSQEQFDKDADRLEQILDYDSPLPGVRDSSGHPSRGLLVLTDVPRPTGHRWFFGLIQHRKGLWVTMAEFIPFVGIIAPPGAHHEDWYYGRSSVCTSRRGGPGDPMVDAALVTGRSARFEHGQSGAA